MAAKRLKIGDAVITSGNLAATVKDVTITKTGTREILVTLPDGSDRPCSLADLKRAPRRWSNKDRAQDRHILSKAFGAALTAARAVADVSVSELSRRIDCDRTCIYRLEAGRDVPSLSTVFAIARSLGTTPEQLVTQTVTRMESARS